MRKIFLLIFLVLLQDIYSLDISITNKEVEAFLQGEYNRSFHFLGDISAAGAIKLNDRLSFKSGLSAGGARDITSIDFFTNTAFDIIRRFPLSVSLAYIYNGLPVYEKHSHTILPLISFSMKYAGIAFGNGLIFTSFFGEKAIIEPTVSYRIYANFVNNERLRIGICSANFNDYHAGNVMSYSLNINSFVRINNQWSVFTDIELMQSGSDGLSSTFYGIACRTGAKFAW